MCGEIWPIPVPTDRQPVQECVWEFVPSVRHVQSRGEVRNGQTQEIVDVLVGCHAIHCCCGCVTRSSRGNSVWARTVNTILSLVDYFGDPLLSWLPLFYVFKAALIVFLTVPDFEVGVPVVISRGIVCFSSRWLLLCVFAGFPEGVQPHRTVPQSVRT